MKGLMTALLPFAIGLGMALILLTIGSSDPQQAIGAFLFTPFSNAFFLGNLLDEAGLILLCALGFLLGMRMGVFNLGGEGQAYLGALVAAETALHLPFLPFPLGLLIGIAAAVAAAAMIGAISAMLWRYLGINELISTFLLSSALIPLIDFALSGPLRDQANNLLASPAVSPDFWLLRVLPPSSLNLGLLMGIALSFLLFFIMKRTRWGFEMRLSGDSREFSRTQGIAVHAQVFLVLAIGAGLQGLAGAFAVYGSHHAAFSGISSGLGWNGIAAALIGRNHPVGAILGALIFAWLGAGAQAAMIHSNISFELSTIIQGTVFLLVTVQTKPWRRFRLVNSKKVQTHV